ASRASRARNSSRSSSTCTEPTSYLMGEPRFSMSRCPPQNLGVPNGCERVGMERAGAGGTVLELWRKVPGTLLCGPFWFLPAESGDLDLRHQRQKSLKRSGASSV